MSGSSGMGCGGKAKGGKSKSGGGNIKTTKTTALSTEADVLLRCRAALFNESGQDRDVSPADFLLVYNKNGLTSQIKFHSSRLPAKEKFFAFNICKESMEDLYDDAGYGWDDDDKKSELGERASRFLVAYDDVTPIAFVNFRFTTQGEYCSVRGGEPCLFIYDIHVAPEHRRKGLGKHLMMLTCLIANQTNMNAVVVPVVNGNDEAKAFFLTKLSGFEVDKMQDFPDIAKELREDGSYKMLSKRRKVVADVSPVSPVKKEKVVVAVESPDSVAASVDSVVVEAPSPPPPPNVVAPTNLFGFQQMTEALPSVEDMEAELEGEEGDELEPEMTEEDVILEGLMEEFEIRNGREATDEEVKLWVETIRSASGGGGDAALEDPEGEGATPPKPNREPAAE
ncbi:hypothetical protein ScalyP_jg2501 [Parmales sp. scaly parma]|nr:hypothetical protein ScalyP_jg2501 [Parmales sp. scaly parma]